MDTLAQYLSGIITSPVVPTNDPSYGDYQWNGAFKLAKDQGRPPRQLAETAAEFFRTDRAIAKVEVAGAGFVNLTVDDAWLARLVEEVAQDPHVGVPQVDPERTVVVDYSSPNVAKRMHVGHLRSTVIGAAIDRLFRAAGYRVVADNHIGDWGTQFGKLIVAWNLWGVPAKFTADPVGELERLYVLFNEESEHDGTLDDQARAETLKLQQGDDYNTRLWQKFVDASMAEYQTVYDRLGVRFDETCGESSYKGDLEPLVHGMLEDGEAVESEGAVVVPVDDGMPPLLVRKKDGASLYGTTDLATVQSRLIRFDPELIVYVTDVRQSLHFRQVFAASRRMWSEVDDGHTKLVHVGFGMLRLPKPEKDDEQAVMSSRTGNTIPLVKLLDEARDRVLSVLQARVREYQNPRIDDVALDYDAVAEAVGVSAIVYADVSRDPATNWTFEWDRVLSLEGNTAPYLLYAVARCHGILRKAGSAPHETIVLTHPAERELALAIVRTPDVILDATTLLKPSTLAEHLYALSGCVARFHLACRVVSVDGVVDGFRLALVSAAVKVMEHGLRILGLKPLERM